MTTQWKLFSISSQLVKAEEASQIRVEMDSSLTLSCVSFIRRIHARWIPGLCFCSPRLCTLQRIMFLSLILCVVKVGVIPNSGAAWTIVKHWGLVKVVLLLQKQQHKWAFIIDFFVMTSAFKIFFWNRLMWNIAFHSAQCPPHRRNYIRSLIHFRSNSAII